MSSGERRLQSGSPSLPAFRRRGERGRDASPGGLHCAHRALLLRFKPTFRRHRASFHVLFKAGARGRRVHKGIPRRTTYLLHQEFLLWFVVFAWIFVFFSFSFFVFFPLCLTICGHAVCHSGPMRPRVVQEWGWPGERDWEAAAPSSCQTPEVRKLIPGREIFIQKQPKNTSSKQKAEGERARVLETGVPLQFPRPGRFKSELFCSRTGTDAYGPHTALSYCRPRASVSSNSDLMPPLCKTVLLRLFFRIWARDFSESHTQSLIN